MAQSRLVRPRRGRGRWIAGVCGGLSDFFGVSVGLTRFLFLLFGLFGIGEIVYIALWILTPTEQRRLRR